MTLIYDPIVTPRQKQIIRGTILGGSSLIKPQKGQNCYLSMRSKKPIWLEYKARELQTLASPTPFTIEKTLRWHSMCYPIFNTFLEEFYKNGKRRLQLEHLDPLQDIGLGIWFVDCGNIKNNCVVLYTQLWGEEGTQIIEEYFKCIRYTPKIFKTRNCWRVGLDKDSSMQFLTLIGHQLPEFYR